MDDRRRLTVVDSGESVDGRAWERQGRSLCSSLRAALQGPICLRETGRMMKLGRGERIAEMLFLY